MMKPEWIARQSRRPSGWIGEIVARVMSEQRDERERRWIQIDVIDDGAGLEEHELEQIFERYATGDAVPTGGESSLGLGLYLVGALCQILGITVRAHSEGKGMGSVFSVLLPVGGY